MNDKNKKPQIKAPIITLLKSDNLHANCTQIARKAMQQEPLRSGATKIRCDINNELGRTDTNSGHSELVRVRFSSLLISVLRLLFTPAHERAPPLPAPAVHSRLSRAGDEHGGRRDDGDRGDAGRAGG
ncbi:MAG: hypothetical protein LUQ20_00725 [Candidatus Methanoperedens sp.]|nr:hypothetical protein [Candidatus Methanoperedens sp.]